MIFELLDNIALIPLPLALCIVIVIVITQTRKINTWGQILKQIFCLILTIIITVTVFIVILLNTYMIAVMWEEQELENEIPYDVKEINFVANHLIWNLIGAALILLSWRFIYFNQLIPGSGTLKSRLKNCWSVI